jgi:hypothetical protein
MVPEVKSVHGYRVAQGIGHQDLVSIAIRFKPTFTPVTDPLALAIQQTDAFDECALSVKALKRVASCKDVDQILKDDNELRVAMVEASAALLAVARYDPDAYRSWAQSLDL